MKTKTIFSLRIALLLPIVAVILSIVLITSCSAEKETQLESEAQLSPPPPPLPAMQSQEPYTEVDEMPVFPDGNGELLKFIGDNTRYPEKAKAAGIQGRVIARFAVTKTGTVDQVSIIKGVSPEIDAETVRVISKLPDFQPGKKDGVPVDVWYTIPITFALRGDEPKSEK